MRNSLFLLVVLLIVQGIDPVAVFAGEKPALKTFEQLTEGEKQRVWNRSWKRASCRTGSKWAEALFSQ